jgi:hypothetical protein
MYEIIHAVLYEINIRVCQKAISVFFRYKRVPKKLAKNFKEIKFFLQVFDKRKRGRSA